MHVPNTTYCLIVLLTFIENAKNHKQNKHSFTSMICLICSINSLHVGLLPDHVPLVRHVLVCPFSGSIRNHMLQGKFASVPASSLLGGGGGGGGSV